MKFSRIQAVRLDASFFYVASRPEAMSGIFLFLQPDGPCGGIWWLPRDEATLRTSNKAGSKQKGHLVTNSHHDPIGCSSPCHP